MAPVDHARMAAEDRRSSGHWLAVLGAVGVALSLWLPWYTLVIPQSVLNEATQNASHYGVLGPVITNGARLLAQLGPIHVNAWKVMTATPALELVAAVVGGGLALLTLTGRAEGVSGAVTACGVAVRDRDLPAPLASRRRRLPPSRIGFVRRPRRRRGDGGGRRAGGALD